MFISAYRLLLLSLCAASVTAAWAATMPRLVPSRRADFLFRRGFGHVVPKQEALLSYSTAPHHAPAAGVAFVAYPDKPILLLEDIDYFLDEVVCLNSHLTVRFADEDAFDAAINSWSQLDEFIVLTAHHGCNTHADRGSWRTIAMTADNDTLTITLTVEPIQMREVGQSFSVRYNHGGGSYDLLSRETLAKRDNHSFDDLWTYEYNPDIEDRLTLFPINGLSANLLSKLESANFNLTCIGCSLHTNVSLGLHFSIDLGGAGCLVSNNQSCFTLNEASMNFTVHDMNLTAALEVALGKEISAVANYSILRVPVAPELSVPGLIELSPAIGLGIQFDLDIATSINFTYGASGHVPSGAFASVSLIDPTGKFNPTVKADGWDGSGVDQIPFRVNDGQFTVTTGMSFAPFAEIPFTILETGAILRLNQNLPQITASASLHTSVTRTCTSITSNDFESFTTAFLVGASMEISTIAELLLTKGVFFGDQGIPDSWGIKMFASEIPLAPTLGVNTSTCFVLSGGVHTDTSVNVTSGGAPLNMKQLLDSPSSSSSAAVLSGVPAATGTLYPAASAIPTWNMSGIESYYNANGKLPTNVNYEQMVMATSVPSGIQKAVQSAAAKESGAGAGRFGEVGAVGVLGGVGLVLVLVLV